MKKKNKKPKDFASGGIIAGEFVVVRLKGLEWLSLKDFDINDYNIPDFNQKIIHNPHAAVGYIAGQMTAGGETRLPPDIDRTKILRPVRTKIRMPFTNWIKYHEAGILLKDFERKYQEKCYEQAKKSSHKKSE